jgi:hypothetical protein
MCYRSLEAMRNNHLVRMKGRKHVFQCYQKKRYCCQLSFWRFSYLFDHKRGIILIVTLILLTSFMFKTKTKPRNSHQNIFYKNIPETKNVNNASFKCRNPKNRCNSE